MEKFDLFEGLTDLRATNLMNGKTPLLKKGGVGSAIKSGDHLSCDLVSKDQWLDVAMQLHDVRLCLLFEVKVINQAKVSELLSMLVSIANLFLESNEIPIRYEVSDLRIERRCSEKEVKLTRGGQLENMGSPLGECLTVPLVFYEDTKIENSFTFLDRKVACQLMRRNEEEKVAEIKDSASLQSPFMSICDSEGMESDISKLRAFPIRYFRKEPFQPQNSTFELQAEETKKRQGLGTGVCCCCLS